MGIVFVCDASDTMVPKMDTLRRELIATINGLRPVQSFNVVFMRDKGCAKVSEDLLLGTPENKQRAEKFIKDFKAGGKTNPSPALKAAFEQQPQLIYLLFDHEFADMAHLPGRIVELNGDHKVKVDTIAFLGDEEPNADFIRVLEQIARENKGSFNQKKVSDL